MKRFIAFLLCIIIITLSVSCDSDDAGSQPSENEIKDVPVSINSSEKTPTSLKVYKPVLEIYRMAVKELTDLYSFVNSNPQEIASELFGLEPSTEKEWFLSIIDAIYFFYGGHAEEDSSSPHHKLSCGYAIKDLNGDGVDELVLLTNDYMVCAIFSIADGNPVLLGNYRTRHRAWIDEKGWIHEHSSNGADHSANAIFRIADGGASIELIVEFGTNGHEWIGDTAYTIYYKLVNGEKETITESEYLALNEQYNDYLGSPAGAESTKNDSGLTFISLYTEDDIAIEMYEEAINDKICVFDEHLGEIKLKSLRFPSNNTTLEECKLLTKAILDVDQDGVNEYVIKSPDNDHIILHYYNGKVYSYCLYSNDYYEFNTDGTFYWYDCSEAEGEECGLNKIIFDGETLNVKSIYSLKHSENPTKYEYFVEGEAVAEDEYYDYRNSNYPKERMTFSYFELTHSYPITAEQAWNLANAYWDNQDGRTEGAAGTNLTARVVLIDTPNSDSNYYRVAYQVEWSSNGGKEGHECMPPYDIQLHDQILVNAFTGEITTPSYESDGKVISVEEAIEIAKNYWEDFDIEENGYRVEQAFNSWAPDSVYVIVILQLVANHYSTFDEIWIDKSTGETIIPYAPDDKG